MYETKHEVLSYPLNMFQRHPELYQFHLFWTCLFRSFLLSLSFVSLLWRLVAGFHHPVLDPLFPATHVSPFMFYLLFGENTSSGNFLRKVARTIKALKPIKPENVISPFSHLIYVHWVHNSAWDLFPFLIFEGFSFQGFLMLKYL